jgi:hypothetical protein
MAGNSFEGFSQASADASRLTSANSFKTPGKDFFYTVLASYGMMRRWRRVVKRSKKLSSVGW